MNDKLTQIEQQIEAKVPPEKKQAYNNAVTAGLKIMFDPKTHQNMELVKNPQSRKDPVGTVAKGVVGLCWLMIVQRDHAWRQQHPNATNDESQNFIADTVQYMIFAGITLMTKAIDYAERGLGIQFDDNMIAQTTKLIYDQMFRKLGIPPEQLQQMIDQNKAGNQSQPQPSGMLIGGA